MLTSKVIMSGILLIPVLVIVLSIAKSGQEQLSEMTDCSFGADIDFIKLGDEPQVCYEGNRIFFSVENNGLSLISGLSVLIESDYNITMTVKKAVLPGQSSENMIGFGTQRLSGVRSIEVSPLASDGHVCQGAGIHAAIEECGT